MTKRALSKLRILHDCLKANPVLVFERPALLKPRVEILALTDIERLELITPVRNRLDANASDSDTATNRETFQVQEMKTNAA